MTSGCDISTVGIQSDTYSSPQSFPIRINPTSTSSSSLPSLVKAILQLVGVEYGKEIESAIPTWTAYDDEVEYVKAFETSTASQMAIVHDVEVEEKET